MWHWEKTKLILYRILAILIGIVVVFATMLGEPEDEEYNQEEIVIEKCRSILDDPHDTPINIVKNCKQLLGRNTNALIANE
jgi:hypothetical protein